MENYKSCEPLLNRIEYLMGAAKIGIDIIDADFNIRYIDPAWKKKYGNPGGKKCYQYFMGRSTVCPGCGVRRALQTKKIVVSEETLAREGGRPIQVTTIPFRGDDGTWLVAETNIDMSKIKEAQEALRVSEEKFRVISERSPIGIAMGQGKKVIYVNQSFADIFGYQIKEIVGKDMLKFVAPGDRKRFAERVQRRLHGEKLPSQYATMGLRKDGRQIHVQIWSGPVVYINGIPTIIATFQDETERKHMEEELRSSEKRFRQLFEDSNDAIFIADPASRMLIDCNGKAEEMTGYSRNEILSMRASRLHPADKVAAAMATFEKMRTGKRLVFDSEILTRDKRRVAVSISGTLVYLEGKPCLKGVFRDISGRKKAQADLMRANSLLASTLESAFVGILVVDLKGKIVSYNKKFSQMWGIPDSVMESHDDRRALGFVVRQLRYPAIFIGKIRELYRHPGVESYDVIEFKDGRVFERYSSPQRMGDKITSRVWTFHDITGLKKAELSLRQSEERYRMLAELSRDAIYIMDLKGRFTYMNGFGARFVGLKPSEAIGKSMRELFGPHMAAMQKQDVKRVVRTGKPVLVTVKIGSHWMDTRLSPIKDARGATVAIMGVSRDITLYKQAEEVLHKSKRDLEKMVRERSARLIQAMNELNKAKRLSDIGLLAATVAHELRTPLAAIRTAAYNIHLKKPGALLESHLMNIDKKVIEADRIIKNLLVYSAIKPPQHEPLDLCLLLDECIRSSKTMFPDSAVSVRAVYKRMKDCRIEADPYQLKEVFYNVLNNAFESFNKKVGKITVNIVPHKKDYVKVMIKDNGSGIESDHVKKVFEPFFTTKASGVGLGLSVCYQIIMLHGGRMEIESNFGKGTLVTVTLPIRMSSQKILAN